MQETRQDMHFQQGNFWPCFWVQIWLPTKLGGQEQPFVTLPCDQRSRPVTSPLQDDKDLPSAKHEAKLEEEIIRKRLCKDVHFLLICVTVRDLDCTAVNMRAKVMILKCNVLGTRRTFVSSCHCYARLVILVDLADESWCFHVYREDFVDFL